MMSASKMPLLGAMICYVGGIATVFFESDDAIELVGRVGWWRTQNISHWPGFIVFNPAYNLEMIVV